MHLFHSCHVVTAGHCHCHRRRHHHHRHIHFHHLFTAIPVIPTCAPTYHHFPIFLFFVSFLLRHRPIVNFCKGYGDNSGDRHKSLKKSGW